MSNEKTYESHLNLPRWLYAGDGDGTGDGGGGTGEGAGGQAGAGGTGGEGGSADLDAKIQLAVDQATAGLKQNRDQILAEKKKLSDQLQGLSNQFQALGGEEGMQRLSAMHETLQKDEMGKLLAAGKHDEWFDQRTAALRGDYEQRLEASAKQLEEIKGDRDTMRTTLAVTLLKTEVDSASLSAGVEKTALDDVRLAASQVFSYDPELKRHIIQDDNKVILLGKDGETPKSVLEWLEEQRQPKRHWFPPSQGAGLNGETGGTNSGTMPDAAAISSMSMADYQKFRKSQGLGGVRQDIPG